MNPCRVGFAALFTSLALGAHPALGCGLPELKTFEEKAQTLEKNAEALGSKLLSCPLEAREAFQWLAFLSSMRDSKAPLIWRPRAAPKASTDKNKKTKLALPQLIEADIEAAYAGSLDRLKGLIDAGNPNYTANFEAQLAVARALFRRGQFVDGRQYFDSALRLGTHEARFDIERTYSFIWEKNYSLADREIGRLAFEGGTPDLTAGLARARSLLAALQDSRSAYLSQAPGKGDRPRVFATNLTSFLIAQEYQRYTGTVEYHDGVDVVFSHHVMANLVYEKQTRQQDVLWIGRERWEYGVFHLGALVGYRTPAQRERLLFDAFAGATLFAEWSATLGVKRTSLVEIVALPRESQDLVQDSLYGRLNVGKTLVVQSSVARDTNRPAFSRQKILLDTPLTLFGDRYGQVYGLVGSEYEARERPSPDYETFRQGIRSHVGTRIVSRIQGDSALKLEIKYQNIHRQGHGMSNWIQNSGLTVDMTGSHQLDQKWSLVGRIAYNGEETLRPTQPFQNRMELKLGAELLQ